MRFFFIAALLFASVMLSACGKRPNALETPTGQSVSQGYPAPESAPGE